MRTAALLAFLVVTPLAYAPPPVVGAGNAVDLPVPAKAMVVVELNGWVKARTRLAALVEKALPGDAKVVKEKIDAGLAEMLDGRQLKGIDPDARLFIALNDLRGFGDDSVPADLFVPVTDADAFRNGFFKEGEKKGLAKKANGVIVVPFEDRFLHVVEKGNYQILTLSEDRAAEYAGKYEQLNTKKMGPDVSATFLNADVALYVDLAKINEAFGDKIKSFRGLIDFAFQNAGGAVPGLDKSQLEASKEMLKSAFQAVEDGRALVVAAEFRPEGVNLRVQGRFEHVSKTGAVLNVEVPDAHAGLAKLPTGFTEYRANRFGPTVVETVGKFSREFAAGEGQEEAEKAVEKYTEAIAAAGPGASRSAAKAPESAVTVTVTEYKDPTAALAAHLAVVKALPAGAVHSGVHLKEKVAVKEAAQTYKGVAYHQVSLVLDFEATVKAIPEPDREASLASLKKTAKEKPTYWIGAANGAVVQVTADDWPAAQKLLDTLVANSQPTAAVQSTRGQLPAEVSFVSLQEVGQALNGIVEQLGALGGEIPGLPFEMPKIAKVTGDPAFVGVAVTLKPEVGQFDLFIPTAAIGLIRKAFE